jgi:hypothetical protein
MTEVKYYDATRASELLDDIVHLLRKKTPLSVRAVNWYADDQGTDELQAIRRQYFDELLGNAEHGGSYCRVLQLDVDDDPEDINLQSLTGKYDDPYREHFAEMVRKRTRSSSKVDLRVSRGCIPTTFVIFDDSAVVVEFNQLKLSASVGVSRWETTGALLIRHPGPDIVTGFSRMFDALYRNSLRVSLGGSSDIVVAHQDTQTIV